MLRQVRVWLIFSIIQGVEFNSKLNFSTLRAKFSFGF